MPRLSASANQESARCREFGLPPCTSAGRPEASPPDSILRSRPSGVRILKVFVSIVGTLHGARRVTNSHETVVRTITSLPTIPLKCPCRFTGVISLPRFVRCPASVSTVAISRRLAQSCFGIAIRVGDEGGTAVVALLLQCHVLTRNDPPAEPKGARCSGSSVASQGGNDTCGQKTYQRGRFSPSTPALRCGLTTEDPIGTLRLSRPERKDRGRDE